LAPEEVPQEEKLRMLNEVMDTDIRKIRQDLCTQKENIEIVKMLTESQD